MATNKANLLWKSFKGIRKLNTINSAEELGADKILNVSLSKEKSGQQRSIRSSGWFNEYATLGEPIIRRFSASMSGYRYPNQLIAFTSGETIKTIEQIHQEVVEIVMAEIEKLNKSVKDNIEYFLSQGRQLHIRIPLINSPLTFI